MMIMSDDEDIMDDEMVDNLVYVVSILNADQRKRLAEVLNMPPKFLEQCVQDWKKARLQ